MKRGDQGWIRAFTNRPDGPRKSVRITDVGIYADDGTLYLEVRDQNHVLSRVPGDWFIPRDIVITEEPDLADL